MFLSTGVLEWKRCWVLFGRGVAVCSGWCAGAQAPTAVQTLALLRHALGSGNTGGHESSWTHQHSSGSPWSCEGQSSTSAFSITFKEIGRFPC